MRPILTGNPVAILGRNNLGNVLEHWGFMPYPIIDSESASNLTFSERVTNDLDVCYSFLNEVAKSDSFRRECDGVSAYNISFARNYFLLTYIRNFSDDFLARLKVV